MKTTHISLLAILSALGMTNCEAIEEATETQEIGTTTGDAASDEGPGEQAFPRADSPAARILSVAAHEEGRGPNDVGDDLGRYPYDLGRYLEPDEAWCSEFVSWVYKVAGYPLTGGHEGGWMILTSESLRSWFQKNSTYISNGSSKWSSFTPQPGDYIKYNNSGSGHSGIVRYMSGSDLYTVEGNVSNRVQLKRVSNWRSQSNIDGIGRKNAGQDDCNGRCSSSCPCDVGQGDCDSDLECKSGLYCKEQSGTDYCQQKSCNGRCSSSCRCDVGQGDCDSDLECKSGLYCKLQSGTDYCRTR